MKILCPHCDKSFAANAINIHISLKHKGKPYLTKEEIKNFNPPTNCEVKPKKKEELSPEVFVRHCPQCGHSWLDIDLTLLDRPTIEMFKIALTTAVRAIKGL